MKLPLRSGELRNVVNTGQLARHRIARQVRATAHDVESFEALYDLHVPVVYGVARRILGPGNAEIENVVQATFVDFWRAGSNVRCADRGGALARRARNAAIDALKRRHNVPRKAVDMDVGDIGQTIAPGVQSVDGIAMRRALASLSGRERSLIETGFFEDTTSVEMAARAQIPVSTVTTMVRSALSKLRLAISDGKQGASANEALDG